MALTKISKSDLNWYKKDLENIKEADIDSKLDIIESTNKNLMNIFNATKKFAEKNITDSLNEVKKILEERKWRLENSKSIKTDIDINKFYTNLDKPTWADITPTERSTIKTNSEKLYKRAELGAYIKLLPPFVDFGSKIRTNPTYKITDIEATKKTNNNQIVDIAKILKNNNHFKWTGLSNEMQLKMTKLIILFSQLDKFDKEGTKKNQLDEANRILSKIELTFKQLSTHQTTKNTINLIDTRIKNIGGIETLDPKDIGTDAPGKNWISSIPYPLKNHFLDPTKGLNEDPEWYEMKKLKFKDKSGKPVEIFKDIDWQKPFDKTLKKGENADIFFKDGGGMVKKFANIEITDTANPSLVVNIESYIDLPSLMFPINFECTMTGIGGNSKKVENKVGITKTLKGTLNKPDFTPEYTSLDGKYKIKQKLDQIFQEQYIAQLKDRFFEFMANNELTKWERNGEPGKRDPMSSDERNHFFQDTIMKNSNPSRLGAGIYGMITNVNQANCYGNIAFADDFQKRILEIFTGKTESELKKLIFEKLWNLDFPELNPEYAIKILADKVKEKYTTHQEWLYQALNAYLLNVRGWGMKVKQEKLYDWSLLAVKEIKAVVADSKEISKEDAYKNALKKIEDEYKSGVNFWYTRAKIFFFREKMLKNLIAKELKGKWGLHMDDTTNSAVNRWAAEKSMGGSFAENIIDVEKDTTEKIFDDPIFQQELDVAVRKYIDNKTTDDATFQWEIEELINGNAELSSYMKRNKITHLGTNIIEQAKAEKAERSYYGETIKIIDRYSQLWMSNKPQEF